MSMNLKLVTYNVDGNEFIVNGRTSNLTLQAVIGANLNTEIMGKYDNEDYFNLSDRNNYTIIDLTWDKLKEIMLNHKVKMISDNIGVVLV